MKLKNLFIAILFIGTLFSCASDDDDDQNDAADFAGTWALTSVDYTGNSVSSGLTSTFVGEAYDISGNLTLTENPNEYTANSTYSIHLTTTVMGQDFTYDMEDLSAIGQDGTWSSNGNTFTIIPPTGESTEFENALSNNGNTLTLDGTSTQSQQGAVSTVHLIAVYTRQ